MGEIIENRSNSNNIVMYSVFGVIIVIIAVVAFLFGNFGGASKEELKKNYIKKSEISFFDLPLDIQNRYVLESKSNEQLNNLRRDYESRNNVKNSKVKELLIDKLKNDNKLLEEEISSLRKGKFKSTITKSDLAKKDNIISSQKEEIAKLKKELANTKTQKDKSIKDMFTQKTASPVKKVIINNKVDKHIFDKENNHVAILKCYDTQVGSYYLSEDCHKNIKEFVNLHKDASRFEVIGVTDKDDFTIINKLMKKDDSLNTKDTELLKDFSDLSLGRYRVIQATWQIKDALGENTFVTPVNYTIHSKKDNRGVVVRVYK